MNVSAVHNDAVPPASEPENLSVEFADLVSGCGVCELSGRAWISLSGSDRVRWLNGMVTNNIRDLAVGRGVYAFLLNPQGHILGDLYAYNRGDSILIDTARRQLEKLLGIFDRYIIMDDVEVSNISDRIQSLAIAGPQTRDVVGAAGIDFPPLQTLQFAEVKWRDAPVTVVRGDHPGVEWYELWSAPEQGSSLRDELIRAGARSVGLGAVELLRIAEGTPRYGQDIRERDLPQETSQDRALHFSKGCYVGQEIVERIRSRGAVHRKFAGFEVAGAMPAPGTKIQANGKDVGELTSAASLPLSGGERPVALGYVRRELASGTEVQTAGAQLTISDLPFAGIFSPRTE